MDVFEFFDPDGTERSRNSIFRTPWDASNIHDGVNELLSRHVGLNNLAHESPGLRQAMNGALLRIHKLEWQSNECLPEVIVALGLLRYMGVDTADIFADDNVGRNEGSDLDPPTEHPMPDQLTTTTYEVELQRCGWSTESDTRTVVFTVSSQVSSLDGKRTSGDYFSCRLSRVGQPGDYFYIASEDDDSIVYIDTPDSVESHTARGMQDPHILN